MTKTVYANKKNRYDYIPLIIIFIFLNLPSILLIFQNSQIQIIQKILQLNDKASLIGVLPVSKPLWSINNMNSGQWQKQFGDWLNQIIPLRNLMVRTHNQFFYIFFSKSFMLQNLLVIGKNDYLYSLFYLTNYCNSQNHIFQSNEYDEWAKNLQKLSDFFNKRHQIFVYIVTPSKASYFPEYLPENYKCSTKPRKNYYLAMQALKKVHINYIDATKLILDDKFKYGNLLFPRGGTHWTQLAGALTNQILIKKITNLTRISLPKLLFTYETTYQPEGTDRDLEELINLLFPKYYYPVPKINYSSLGKKSKSLNISLIGDSFLIEMLPSLIETKIFDNINYYFYLHKRFHLPSSLTSSDFLNDGLELDINDISNFKDILSADVVILEENEVHINSEHTKDLAKLILKKV